MEVLECEPTTTPIEAHQKDTSMPTPESNDDGLVDVSPSSGVYTREVVERLLSLLPPEESIAFMRTHVVPPLRKNLPAHGDKQELFHNEVNAPSSKRHDDVRAFVSKSHDDVGPSECPSVVPRISKKQYEKKLRELAKDEKKYRKTQKQKQELKERNKATVVEKEVPSDVRFCSIGGQSPSLQASRNKDSYLQARVGLFHRQPTHVTVIW